MTFGTTLSALFTLVAAFISVKVQVVSGVRRLGSPHKGQPEGFKNHDLEEEQEQEQRSLQSTLPNLVLLGNNGNPSYAYPLGRCEGDCDNDSECQLGFKCFHRQQADSTTIPGCSGQPVEAKDYCYNPYEDPWDRAPGVLAYVGDNNGPTAVFPLGHCQGDCDNDNQCQDGLKCFRRDASEPVPGCNGTGMTAKDYCYQPETFTGFTSSGGTTIYYPEKLVFRGESTNPKVKDKWFPLALCEGDCDSDSECQAGLRCFQRKGSQQVPGCSGTGKKGRDYCYNPAAEEGDVVGSSSVNVYPTEPADDAYPTGTPLTSIPTPSPTKTSTHSPTAIPTSNPSAPLHPSSVPSANPTEAPSDLALIIVGNNGSPSDAFPLGLCQGDCDNDNECREGLICFHRGGSEPVPGCEGTGVDANDYCIEPPTPSPTVTPSQRPSSGPAVTASPTILALNYVGNNGSPSDVFPLGICEGDCDNDSQCQEGLTCFHRGGNEPVPGCQGTGISKKDYCYRAPTPSPTLIAQAQATSTPLNYVGNNGKPKDAFPLGLCEGDCDNDNQCQEDLVCFQRGSKKKQVPGCEGTGEKDHDYCIKPGAEADFTGTSSTGPQTWGPFRLKMHWEEGFFWQEDETEQEWCMECRDGCEPGHMMVIRACRKVNTKFVVVDRDGELGLDGDEIKVAGKNLCFKRVGARQIQVHPCALDRKRFRWIGFNATADKFALHPVEGLGTNGCISQHHHPKKDELLYVEACELAHAEDTGHWVRYY